MCRILPAPRLEHNPLHAVLSVTTSALTSSDKSIMKIFNSNVRQAHLTAPHLHSTNLKSSVLSWLRTLKCSCEAPNKLPNSNPSNPILFLSIRAVGIDTAHEDDSPNIVKEARVFHRREHWAMPWPAKFPWLCYWMSSRSRTKYNECCDSIPWMTVLLKT